MRPILLIALAAAGLAQTVVPTAQYDNQRTGANWHEALLTPRNVHPATFGKLFVLPVDGDTYAQPLFVPRLEIPGKGVHNVVFVATEHDSVYAFDAAGRPDTPLWHVSFLRGKGVTTVPQAAVGCQFIEPEIGITSTPVIDAASRTMYVLVRTSEPGSDARPRYYQRLHALDIADGAERPGSPVLIRASVRVPGLFGLWQSEVSFHALRENPRAGMLLTNGNVYMAWGSSCDVGPYYGWVLAYDSRTLQQTGVFNASPSAGESGIWQADTGIAADEHGDVYAVTGNGTFNGASGGRDYGDSVLKMGFANGALAVRDYFTPSNQSELNAHDADLGSGGPVLLPDQPGPHPHLLVTAGKGGVLYVIDRDRMGQFHAGSDSHAIQTIPAPGPRTAAFGAPAYWNGHLYYSGSNAPLKDFAVNQGRLSTVPIHQGGVVIQEPGAIPSISANGTKDGIVWVLRTKGWEQGNTYGVLQAYDAHDVSQLLYTTDAGGRDSPGMVLRFTVPTVADGRVYVGMRHALFVYGLRDSPRPKPR